MLFGLQKFNPSFTYYWRLTAKDWVKSPEAPNGMLQYQFRYSMNGGTESIVSNTGASTIATVNPWGPATYHFFVYVINPGAPASAPGDQPNGARLVSLTGFIPRSAVVIRRPTCSISINKTMISETHQIASI